MKTIIFILIFIFVFNKLFAQSDDFGVWIDLSASKKIKSTDLTLYGEYYTKNNSQTIERTSIGFGACFPIISFMKVDAGYLLLNYNMTDYFEIRNRFFTSLAIKWELQDFVFSLRERIQLTTNSQSGFDVANVVYWRNRFRAEYKNPIWKVYPLATIESFHYIGSISTNTFDEFRYSLAAKYSFTKNQDIMLYGLWSDAVSRNFYVIGLEYEISI
ncbi:MAG: DUF2490 domain-containing protein [Prolixibacteraceae bacterium]|nr:DUF2490 domain-containing protein [Prolixibacteraceae bacterium]